jgi:hypothetical protein
MAIDLTYPNILTYISPYQSGKRTESAAFLIWYLMNYYRLDELDATDCVCDQHGDKGVDGIYVNEGSGTIDIFQSKISQKANSSVGDTQLKEFQGTLTQFQSAETLANVVAAAGDTQVAALIKSLDLQKKVADYQIRGIFVVNLDLDKNGTEYLKMPVPISVVGKSEMESSYISDAKEVVQSGKAEFDIFGLSVTDYAVDAKTKATIAPVLASDLVSLAGITDQSLFSANVRASLGGTKVNKDIASSIRDSKLHKAFPLFHNGITVLAKSVSHDDKKITIEDYYVVNGCQSLNTLYANKSHITNDLRVLTKFIQVEVESDLAELITTNSNNQNGVKARDFKSNHPIQTRLQHEFTEFYGTDYAFEVKRGEPIQGSKVISNENAGLLLIAFDLQEPWTTHRKYQIFDDRYSEVFGRPEVTAHRIVLLEEISKCLLQHLPSLKNDLIGKYLLTRYLMLLVIRKILELDDAGQDMMANPIKYVQAPSNRAQFRTMMNSVVSGLIIDLDVETQELADDFDYRGKLRDKEYVLKLVSNLVATHRKDVMRKKALSIGDAWKQSA